MNAARIERALPYWLWPSDWWDALIASDPDRERLYAGARGVLSTALSAALLAAVARRTNQPIAVVLVGAMVGMMATMAVQDPDERSRRVTTLLLPLPAAAAVLLAAALPPGGVAGSAALLALTFAAVYVRRRGARATALGMLAFLAYFNATFFGATLAQAPWMIASLVAGTAVTFVVRFALLPERPGGAPLRALGAYRRSVALLLARLADAVRAGRPPPVASVRRAVRGVNDAAVRLETRLGADDRRPLDVELAAARVVGALRVPSRAALSPEARAEIAQALLDARRALRRPRATAPGAGLAPDARDASAAGGVAAFEKAAGGEEFDRGPELAAALRTLVGAELWGAALGPAAAPPPPPPPPPPTPAGTLAPSTRQAIQATVACAIAMALGRLLSSERWQWAVMAAFVVFARVTTRGDTIARAWQRVLGTVAGVAVGAAIAHVAHGHPRVELGLVFALLFAALYLLRASQALMVLAISALLALLYDLMGRFSPGL
ncbi:MAG TPA: FUSC family protein, partial [Polyangiaceae bacterium]|nr:FUSC family protein [Polyangiaceae bacterium]